MPQSGHGLPPAITAGSTSATTSSFAFGVTGARSGAVVDTEAAVGHGAGATDAAGADSGWTGSASIGRSETRTGEAGRSGRGGTSEIAGSSLEPCTGATGLFGRPLFHLERPNIAVTI